MISLWGWCNQKERVKAFINTMYASPNIYEVAVKNVFWMNKVDDNKLFEIIKNTASKTVKFRNLNISLVSSLFNNNGAIITVDPFKKNKHSDMKNFFLKKNTVSSFPK